MSNLKYYLFESTEMESSNVHKILKYSEQLQNMITPDDKLEDWVKAKLTHAADYITTVVDYLTYYNPNNKINEHVRNYKKKVYFLLNEDYDSEMSLGDLKNIHDKALKLQQLITKFNDLEDWVEAKITLAGEYLDDIYHYLDYKKSSNQNKLDEIDLKKSLTTGALFLSTLLPVSSDTYLVQKGDTLSKISKVLNVSLTDLKKLNPDLDPDKIQIGQEIKVPDKITNVYSIKKGDTLSKIAKKMNVSLDDLKRLNPDLDPNKLQIGQEINLPDVVNNEQDKTQEVNLDSPFDEFINAMHQVESNGRITKNSPILGDDGNARGPLQIWKVYFEDAKQYSDDPIVKNGKYEDVDDLDFSKRVVYQYLRRYANTALKNNDFETLARIHNGGPSGANPKYIKRYNKTGNYWNKLKKHL